MAALNPAAPLGPFAVPDDQDGETGASDTPKATLGRPSLATTPAAPLPAVPLGSAQSGDSGAPAFQGARQFIDASHAVQDWAQGKTPSSAPPAMRWNTSFGPNGAHWSDSPEPGTGSFHDPSELNDFLRPTTGPLSAAAVAARNAYPLSPIPAPRPDIGPAINPLQGSAQAAPSAPSAVLKTPAAAAAAANGQGSLDGSKPDAASTPATGVTIGGRHLPYGAMVNGVPTFSDGTHGIARTMSDDQIKSLGDRLNIGNYSALASDALGYTPSSAQMVGQDLAQLRRYQPITGSRPSAADFAASDRNAILRGDWRSAAGTTAHNLAVDASEGGRAQQVAYQQGLSSLLGGVSQAAQDDAASQARADQADNAMNLENLRGQYGLADTRQKAALERFTRKGSPVTLADGTLGLLDDATGMVTPAKMPSGQPVRELQDPKKEAGAIFGTAGGAKLLDSMTNRYLGVNPLDGTIPDPSAPGGRRAPKPAEIARATQAARDTILQMQGGAGAPTVASAAAIPDSAAAALRQNPALRTQFDQKYGNGASARILGQ